MNEWKPSYGIKPKVNMTYQERLEKTNDIVKNLKYQIGDTFQESFHFWLYIINVNDDEVTTLESRSRLEDFVIKKQTKEELSNRLRYHTIDVCWVDYHNSDVNHVIDLVDKYKKAVIESKDIAKIRDMKLGLML